jgi:23S rRNA (guanosine2251-2'-O)-methyltransferase
LRTEQTGQPGNRTDRTDKSGKQGKTSAQRPERSEKPRPERSDKPRSDRTEKPRSDRTEKPRAEGGPVSARPPRRTSSDKRSGGRSGGRDGGRDQIYGRNAVLATLNGPRHVETVFLADTVGPDPRIAEIKELARKQHVDVQTVSRLQIENYVGKVNHQGVLALADRFAYSPLAVLLERPGTILVLDHISDPQNLGTLLRTGAAFDIAGLVIPTDRSASITPAVVNASAGAIETIPVAQVVNLKRAVTEIKEQGRWTIGLDSGEDSQSIYEVALPTPSCLILGSEGKGISRQVREMADIIVRIPIGRSVESLNVATAGSIVLFELGRIAFASSDRVEVASEADYA